MVGTTRSKTGISPNNAPAVFTIHETVESREGTAYTHGWITILFGKNVKSEEEPKGRFQALLRMLVGLFVAFILVYATHGIYVDDLYVPHPRGGLGVHFHGTGALAMFGAFFCLAAFLISTLVRSFDHPSNKPGYRTFNRWMKYLGLCLLVIAFLLAILSPLKK